MPDELIGLQRDAGNQAVTTLVQRATPADEQLFDDEFRLGRKLVGKKDFAGAERVFRQMYADAAFDADGSPGVLLNLGMVLQAQGKFDEAMSFYQEVIDSSKDVPESKAAARDGLRSARMHSRGQ